MGYTCMLKYRSTPPIGPYHHHNMLKRHMLHEATPKMSHVGAAPNISHVGAAPKMSHVGAAPKTSHQVA